MQTAVDDRQVTRERDSDGDKADSQQCIAAERESLHSTHGECVAVRSLLGKAHSPRVQVFHSRTSTHTNVAACIRSASAFSRVRFQT